MSKKETFQHFIKRDSGIEWYLHCGNDGMSIRVFLNFLLGLMVILDDEDGFVIRIGLLFFSLTLTFNTNLTRRLCSWAHKSKNSKYSAYNRMYGIEISKYRLEACWHLDDGGHSDVRGYGYSFWFEKFWTVGHKTFEKTGPVHARLPPFKYHGILIENYRAKVSFERVVSYREVLGFKLWKIEESKMAEVEPVTHLLHNRRGGIINYTDWMRFGMPIEAKEIEAIKKFVASCKEDYDCSPLLSSDEPYRKLVE